MALPESFLQELRLKTDIEDIISSYVTLKRRGRTLVGLCPFHNEKTPSFTVYPETQSFYCFGCGAGGDAIGFIKKIDNLDYIDAVKSLAQKAGLQMPEDGFDDSLAKMRRRILEINRATARFYNAFLMSEEGKAGLNYFLSRGLTKKTITKFGLGYAPDEWDRLKKHLFEQGFYENEMLAAGVIKRSSKGNTYDMFRNRVMTPIIDIRGNVIAFGGRVLDDSKPKYINTSDTVVYKKTNELFGLNLAKNGGNDTLILCEGYMDVIAMHQAGFENAVAGCGTALTSEQVRLISRYAKEVILAYDADGAGKKALNRAIDLFKQTHVKVRIPRLTGGKDPDEIIKIQGKEKFAAMLESSSNEIEYALVNLRADYNLNLTQDKADYVSDAIKILADATPVEQDLYVSRLCEELSIDKESFKIQLNQYLKIRNRAQKKRERERELTVVPNEERKLYQQSGLSAKQIKAEDRLIGLLLKYPQCRKLTGDFSAENLSPGFMQKVFNLAIKLIDDGVDTDLMSFSGELTESELGRLSGIIARFDDSKAYKQEFEDCIKAITQESKSSKSVSDDELRNMIKNLKESNNK